MGVYGGGGGIVADFQAIGMSDARIHQFHHPHFLAQTLVSWQIPVTRWYLREYQESELSSAMFGWFPGPPLPQDTGTV